MLVSNPTSKQSSSPVTKKAMRKLDRKQRKVAAKAAPAGTPTPANTVHQRRALVYSASPTLGPNASVESQMKAMRLQINALTLSVEAQAEMIQALSQGSLQIKPNVAAATGVVTPMRAPGKAKEAKASASAVPVAGNEAEELDLSQYGTQVQPPSPPEATPKGGSNVVALDTKRSAANDEDSHREGATPSVESEPVVQTTNNLLGRFGWSDEEQLAILSKEYKRREANTQRVHGMGYDDLRIKRAMAQREYDYCPPAVCDSSFPRYAKQHDVFYAQLTAKQLSKRVKAGMQRDSGRASTVEGYANTVKRVALMKAGINHPESQRLRAQRAKRQDDTPLSVKAGHHYPAILAKRKGKIAEMGSHAHPPKSRKTVGSVTKAAVSRAKDLLDSIARPVSGRGINWGASRRAKVVALHDFDRKSQGLPLQAREYTKLPSGYGVDTGKQHGPPISKEKAQAKVASVRERLKATPIKPVARPKATNTTTQAEVVRAANRAGIGY